MKIEDILRRNLDALMSQHEDLGSQQKLSKRCGVGQTSVGRMRRGEGSATIDNVHAVAKAFGLTANDLLDPGLGERLQKPTRQRMRIEKIVQTLRSGNVDDRQLKLIEVTLAIE